MSLLGDMIAAAESDIWKALGDDTRRAVLDLCCERPHSTGELCAAFPDLCRTNVMKHLDVLASAGLIVVRREGRVRWNHANPEPLKRICRPWIQRHVARLSGAMARLKDVAEAKHQSKRSKP